MGRIIFFFVVLLSGSVCGQTTYTWTGATSNSFNNLLNWNPVGTPNSSSNVEFNSSSSAACNLNVAINVNNFTIKSGYNGTISSASALTHTVNGNFSQSSGTFACTGGELSIFGNLTYTAGAFLHNNGTVSMYVASGGTSSIVGSPVFNRLNVLSTLTGTNQRNFNFGSSTAGVVNLGITTSLFAYQGTINVTNSLSINGSNTNTPVSNSGIFNFNGSSATIGGALSAGQNRLGNITINTSGALAMSGNVSLSGNWTKTQSASLTAGSSTVHFYGSASNVISGSTTATRAKFDNLTVAPSSTVTFGAPGQVNVGVNFTNNGVVSASTTLLRLTGSGVQSIGGTSTLTTINSLEVTNSGVKTISNTLNVLDSVKINVGTLVSAGNLRLKATASLKARLAQITGGGALSGNIVVETFAPGGKTDWAVLGVNGVSSQSVANWSSQIPMTCSFCPNGPNAAGGYFVSIRQWNELAPATSSLAYLEGTNNTLLTPGKGFWVYLGSGQVNTSPLTWTVSGPAVTGDYPIALTNSGVQNGDGYNLISNPYASPISWTKLRNNNSSVQNAIYIYNADLGTTTSFVNGVSSHTAGSATDIIPAGQGFYVRSVAATSTLLAKESNKMTANTAANPLLRQANSNPQILRLRVEGFDGYNDETVLRFEHSASPSFDSDWDAYKLYSSPGYQGYPGTWTSRTAIASQYNGVDFSINTLPPAYFQDLVMPILVRVYASGQYSINSSGLENIPDDACVLLEDKVLKKKHDLRTGQYVCNINDTTMAARFVLSICATNTGTPPVGMEEKTGLDKKISIYPDATGVRLDLEFQQTTRASITITNILGQKLIRDKEVFTSKETLHFELPAKNEILFVTVSTSNGSVTKKIIR